MRKLTPFALWVGLLIAAPQAEAQDLCRKLPGGCPKPSPAASASPVRPVRAKPVVVRPVATVATFNEDFAGSPVELFASEDVSKLNFDALAPKVAAFIKSSGFRRNPLLSTDRNGLYTWHLDLVASFEQNKGVSGYFQYAVSWNGAIWPFESRENARKFIADPDKYLPEYGGHCTYCLTIDHIVGGDTVEVYKGKIYIFAGESYRKYWEDDRDGYIVKADRKWRSLPLRRLEPVGANSVTDRVSAALAR